MSNSETPLDALDQWQRRVVCVYLLERSEDLFTFDELLTALASEARTRTDGGGRTTRRSELAIRLHHVHLPKLADAALLTYDTAARLVRTGPALSAAEGALRQDENGDADLFELHR